MEDRLGTHPVKLTVTYQDGSVVDYPTFIAAVVEGLILAGKENGRILYIAPAEGFRCYSFASIAATPEVAVALLKSVMEVVSSMVENMPPEIIVPFMEALLSLSVKKTVLHSEVESCRMQSKDN